MRYEFRGDPSEMFAQFFGAGFARQRSAGEGGLGGMGDLFGGGAGGARREGQRLQPPVVQVALGCSLEDLYRGAAGVRRLYVHGDAAHAHLVAVVEAEGAPSEERLLAEFGRLATAAGRPRHERISGVVLSQERFSQAAGCDGRGRRAPGRPRVPRGPAERPADDGGDAGAAGSGRGCQGPRPWGDLGAILGDLGTILGRFGSPKGVALGGLLELK